MFPDVVRSAVIELSQRWLLSVEFEMLSFMCVLTWRWWIELLVMSTDLALWTLGNLPMKLARVVVVTPIPPATLD